MPQPMQNPKDSSDPTTAMNTTLTLLAKAFKVNTIPTNNNQRSSLIPRNSQIAQSGMNTSQDIKMQMVDDNVGNQVRQNAFQNPGIHIVENMNALSVVSEIVNHYGNGDVVTPPAEGNGNGINEEEAGIQSTQEECEFMAADAYEETERVKVNCTSRILCRQASTSEHSPDNALVYDSEWHELRGCPPPKPTIDGVGNDVQATTKKTAAPCGAPGLLATQNMKRKRPSGSLACHRRLASPLRRRPAPFNKGRLDLSVKSVIRRRLDL
ncbi:hypothetical protein Tco_0794630 [Tanacetum coccineum]